MKKMEEMNKKKITFPKPFLSHEKKDFQTKLSWFKYHKANKSYP